MEVVPLNPPRSDTRRPYAERRENGAIEALRGGEVGDVDRHVVEHRPTIASSLSVTAIGTGLLLCDFAGVR
jgi:hypothetical protein